MEQLTLANLFVPAGYIGAAVAIRYFVELLKGTFPKLGERVSGALQAFVASGALYVAGFLAIGPFTPEGGFHAFLSWLIVAGGAVGIDATLGHVTGSDQRKAIELAARAYDLGLQNGTRVAAVTAAPGGTD